MKIGVLGLQGDFLEHVKMLELIIDKEDIKIVKLPTDTNGLDGLIIPGGESTAIGNLITKRGIDKEIIDRNLPIFGTCAGAIILAKDIIGSDQFSLDLMDIQIERNGYGRQTESFETDLEIPLLSSEGSKDRKKLKKFRGVFIRAPIIKRTGEEVEILSTLDDDPVLVKQNNLLASTFHPELTDDPDIHRFFLERVV